MTRSYLRNANNVITDGPKGRGGPTAHSIIRSPIPVQVPTPDSSLGVGPPEGTASPHLADAAVDAACVAFPAPGQHHPERPHLDSVVAAADAAAQASEAAQAA